MRPETKKKVERIQALVAGGMKVPKACETVGMNPTYYYSLRKQVVPKLPAPKKEPTYQAIPILEPRTVPPASSGVPDSFRIEGSPKDVAEFVFYISRAMHKVGGAE